MNSDVKVVLLTAVGTIVGVLVLQHLQKNWNKAASTTTTMTGSATVS
jgi:hypothetical protein